MPDDDHQRGRAGATHGGSPPAVLPGTTPLTATAVTESAAVAAPGHAAAGPPGGAVPESEARADPPAGPAVPAVDADELWATPFGAVTGADHPFAVAVAGEHVYLGGDFTGELAGLPGGTFVRVAHWDGSCWRRMGDGVDAAVHAIAVVGDDVYVGGELTTAGGAPAAGLARWDGRAWSEVAGGLASGSSWVPVSVRALACDGERLYVAGAFDTAGSGDGAVAARGFVTLDLGTGAWLGDDGGLGFGPDPGEGRALALAAGRVYVGGSFDRAGTVETASLAALDPATGAWEGFGAGVCDGDLGGTVDALAVDEGTGAVYVGGRFTSLGDTRTSGLATLTNGRPGSLGGLAYHADPAGAHVVALAHAGGRLYAAGTFTTAGGVEVEHWACHDGTGWGAPAPLDEAVLALATQADAVVVAGRFGHSGDVRVPRAGVWTGGAWRTFGQGLGHDPYANVLVYALAVTPDGVCAGGYFDQAGPVRVASVAQWRDGGWHAMAGGVRSEHVLGEVFAMLTAGGDLYATGEFERAGDVAAANIARWDGTRWHPLGGGVQGTGYALALLGGRLFVGGSLHRAGDTTVSNLASWDPSDGTWSAVGSVPTYDREVFALAVLDDRYLVVGGRFATLYAGRFQVSGMNGLVLFDTHAEPQPANPWAGYSRLPGVTQAGLPGVVSTLRVLGDAVHVGGSFDAAGVESWNSPPGTGFPASNLATWHHRAADGHWSAPGAVDRAVKALATLDGRNLVVGGGFGSAGGVDAAAVVEHDPATGGWTPYGSGIGWGARGVRQVEALAQSPDDGLWVAGTFTVAGGAPSCGVALWRGTVDRQP